MLCFASKRTKAYFVMSKINWNYIAGFIDGEGSIVKNGEKDYRIAIPQTHEGVLKEIKSFTGVGNICKVKKRKDHWKESWIYYVAKQEDVFTVLKQIHPYSIVKKDIVLSTIPKVAKIIYFSRRKKLNLEKKIKACKNLRKNGLSYRKIGAKLNIDHGYVRKLVLYK
ncbi:MAG: LAGLIDADG family homing endonuclease [Patescibacteria group bacterium]